MIDLQHILTVGCKTEGARAENGEQQTCTPCSILRTMCPYSSSELSNYYNEQQLTLYIGFEVIYVSIQMQREVSI